MCYRIIQDNIIYDKCFINYFSRWQFLLHFLTVEDKKMHQLEHRKICSIILKDVNDIVKML